MKPHPRIRKTIKWGGAVVTFLLAVVWIGSGWWCVIWGDGKGGTISVRAGGLAIWNVEDIDGDPWDGWYLLRDLPPLQRSRFQWKFEMTPGGASWGLPRALVIPLWAPTLVVFIPTVIAWRLDALARRRERVRLRLCLKCNYDRSGIAADAKCPECGSVPT
jgi:hypothetical protein